MNPLAKYKIGLGVLGGLTLVLFVMVVVQASGTKHDNLTYKTASKVADKLDQYVNLHGVPESLKDAGISDAPAAVSYRRLSDSQYEFCVTYKSASSGFDATSFETELLTGGASSSGFSSSSTSESSYLYLSPNHHKGKNCQKVKSYDYNLYDNSGSSSSSSGSSGTTGGTGSGSTNTTDCNIDANGNPTSDTEFYACLDKKYGTPSSD